MSRPTPSSSDTSSTGITAIWRSWLLDEDRSAPATSGRAATQEPWNHRDWYVSFGEGPHRSWDDARAYGFVSAGGKAWFWRTLRSLKPGDRIFVYIPQVGYVGAGEVTGAATPFDAAQVSVNGSEQPLRQRKLKASYQHDGQDDDPDKAEYVVPVQWIKTFGRDDARSKPGLFANQNSACKLRSRATLDFLYKEFDVDPE